MCGATASVWLQTWETSWLFLLSLAAPVGLQLLPFLCFPHAERNTFHHAFDQRYETVIVAFGLVHDSAHGRHVFRFKAAAERVDHQLFGDRRHEHIRSLEKRISQSGHSFNLCAVCQLT